MSNFSAKGYRENKLEKNKLVKKHVSAFYKILSEMEEVSQKLDKNIEYNEDNINEYVNPIYGRDLDSMEKMLVLGKLHYRKEEN